MDQFDFTLDEVNWLGNCINLVYLPAAPTVPWLYGRLGLRKTVGAHLPLPSANANRCSVSLGLFAVVVVRRGNSAGSVRSCLSRRDGSGTQARRPDLTPEDRMR